MLIKDNRGSGSDREAIQMSLRYMAYMLRMWWENSSDPQTVEGWRFSIQDTGTGTQRMFVSLAELDAYLRKEMVTPHTAQRRGEWPANKRAQTGSLPQPDDLNSRIRLVENVVDETPDPE